MGISVCVCVCVWSLSDGNEELKSLCRFWLMLLGEKVKLLVTTVGRENICFIYLTNKHGLSLKDRYTLTMRIFFK